MGISLPVTGECEGLGHHLEGQEQGVSQNKSTGRDCSEQGECRAQCLEWDSLGAWCSLLVEASVGIGSKPVGVCGMCA